MIHLLDVMGLSICLILKMLSTDPSHITLTAIQCKMQSTDPSHITLTAIQCKMLEALGIKVSLKSNAIRAAADGMEMVRVRIAVSVKATVVESS